MSQMKYKKYKRGRGFFGDLYGRAKNFFKTNTYKWDMIKLLEQIGNFPVTQIIVCREPLANAIDTALNALSLGKWESLKSKQGVDTFFHLFMLITVNGKRYLLEKNANINLVANSDRVPNEQQPVSIPTPHRLNDMLEKTRVRMGDDRYYRYDAFTNNCQDFVMAFLTSNGLSTPALQTFVKQDTTQLIKEMPGYVKAIAGVSTDLGHIAGAGRRKVKIIHRKIKKR